MPPAFPFFRYTQVSQFHPLTQMGSIHLVRLGNYRLLTVLLLGFFQFDLAIGTNRGANYEGFGVLLRPNSAL